MQKNILILKGSPRQKGNSNILADQVAEGANQAGALVESVRLHGLDIRPCDACDSCIETGVCVLKDDMQPIYSKLLAADALVLSSPIYWFTYSAQLKTCIDRWYSVWNYKKDLFKSKPVGIVLTYGDSDLYNSGGINAIHSFETMFRFLQADIFGIVHASLDGEGEALQHPELLEQARLLGVKLAR
ncbi:MAG: flavodoxin family protein [Chloroflexota bacterium]